MSHDRLLVFADENTIGRGAVEVAERRENFAHLVHEVRPQQVVLPLAVFVLRLRLEATQLAGKVGSSPVFIFRQHFVIFSHFHQR